MKSCIAIAIVFSLCFLPAIAMPEEDGIWVTKEAYVVLGEGMTLQEAKDLVRQRARDMAVEEGVGTFIKGSTIIHNYQLAEDIVSSLRRGIIVAEEVIKEGIVSEGKNTGYSITLKAKVKPIAVERGEGLGVKIALNREVFKENEEVQIRVTPTKDCYIYIFDIFQDDMVTMLIPNRYLKDNYIKANTELIFPSRELNKTGIRLKAMLPQGFTKAIEKVKVIATTKRIEFFDKEIKEAIFSEFDGKSNTLIVNIFQALGMQEPSTWTEATAVYEIRK